GWPRNQTASTWPSPRRRNSITWRNYSPVPITKDVAAPRRSRRNGRSSLPGSCRSSSGEGEQRRLPAGCASVKQFRQLPIRLHGHQRLVAADVNAVDEDLRHGTLAAESLHSFALQRSESTRLNSS